MKISEDYETTNRTVLEIIRDIINQVLPIISMKTVYIFILYFSFDRVIVYFLVEGCTV